MEPPSPGASAASPLGVDGTPVEGSGPNCIPSGPRGFLGSVKYALDGLVETAATQRNMKVHVVSAVLVGLVGSGIPLGLAEKVTLIFCVMLVFFAETLNTALEALVDLYTVKYHVQASATKNAAAGGVLVLAAGTVVIFAALLVHNAPVIASNGWAIARQLSLGTPLATLTGLLLWRRPRAVWIDHLLFAAGLGLLAALAIRSQSEVFTTLTAGVFCLSRLAAGYRARHEVPRSKLRGPAPSM
jgi:diacylglycerol kinase (ATP)